MRIAIVPAGRELEAMVVAAGHELADVERADAVVLDGSRPELYAAVSALPATPRVLATARPAPSAAAWWFPGMDRASTELVVDAHAPSLEHVAAALAWALAEDRAGRRHGDLRLTCIGSYHLGYGEVFALPAAGAITLGRSHALSRPDIRVPAASIARHHARIECGAGPLCLRDLASTNGTLLVRRGSTARLLAPTDYGREAPSPPWLVRDCSDSAVALAIGDEIVLPGFARLRLDGATS